RCPRASHRRPPGRRSPPIGLLAAVLGRLEAGLGFLVFCFWIDVDAAQLAFVHLTESDRQRLLLHSGLDQWADVIEQALAELGVVGVDLPSSLGGAQHAPGLWT